MGNRTKGKKKPKSIKAATHSRMGSKRKLSRMGSKKSKNLSAVDYTFIGRSAALRKLQVSIKDFRRLCILKGVYPREPRRAPRKKRNQVFYHIADIKALAHEPLLMKFREFKTFMKRVRRASGKNCKEEAQRQMRDLKPEYTLHHLVRERYPRFRDALADLDDALTLTYLFAALPSDGKIKAKVTNKAKKLAVSWGAYCATTSSINKSFISVKGVYMEAVIPNFSDLPIRWIIPHSFTQNCPKDVDYRVMVTFFEFYETLLEFVLFKLYSDIGIRYPLVGLDKASGAAQLCEMNHEDKFQNISLTVTAAVDAVADNNNEFLEKNKKTSKLQENRMKTLSNALNQLPVEEDDEDNKGSESDDNASEGGDDEMDEEGLKVALQTTAFEKESERLVDNASAIRQNLFSGLTFFLSREIPRGYLEILCLSYGAKVGWDGIDSPIAAEDPSITHHVIDRPKLPASFGSFPKSREYVQPQWIFDCSNFRFLLPVKKYGIGAALPPHLSPWVNNDEEGYKPAYAEEIEKLKNGELLSDDEEMDTSEPRGVDSNEEDAESVDEQSIDEEEKESSEEDEDDDEEEEEEEEDESEKLKSSNKKKQKEDDEAKELAKLMMSKKAKRLYGRMQYGIAEKQAKVDLLKRKREEIEQTREKNKNGKTLNKQKVERLKKERRDLEKEYDNVGASMKKKKKQKK
jgi:pescadillo protein